MEGLIVISLVAGVLIWGPIGYSMASKKRRGTEGYWMGALLGVIGLCLIGTLEDYSPRCPECLGRIEDNARRCCNCGHALTSGV